MKNYGLKLSMLACVFALILTSCGNNKEAEKKIAELEKRLAEVEGGSTPSAATPAVEPEQKPEGPLPTFEFPEEEHDFGTINEGDIVEHVFKFKNTGEDDLIIQTATGSCGCTVPSYPKEPIPVGGEGEIHVKFNSKGKPNLQNKTVTITANTWPKQTRLKIKAMVTPKPADEVPADGPVKQ